MSDAEDLVQMIALRDNHARQIVMLKDQLSAHELSIKQLREHINAAMKGSTALKRFKAKQAKKAVKRIKRK